MASKTAKAAETEKRGDDGPDCPLTDSTHYQAVKNMLAPAKKRGYVTYDEIDAALPQGKVSSEQIGDTMTMLSEMGVNVVENDEAEDHPKDSEGSAGAGVPTTAAGTKESTEGQLAQRDKAPQITVDPNG